MIVATGVIFVNGIPCMVSVLRWANFRTVEYVSLRLDTLLSN